MKKIIIWLTVSFIGHLALGGETVQPKKMFVEDYLEDVGKRYDVFFAAETAYARRQPDYILSQTLAITAFPTNVDMALATLTNLLTNITVRVDSHDRRVHYVMDRRLLEMPDYVMNRTLTAVDFSGNASDYLEQLGQTAPPIVNDNNVNNGGGPIVVNHDTAISIHEKNIAVREALTRGVNLEGYNRIIWTSCAYLDSPKTEIKYNGLQRIFPPSK